MSIDVSSRRPCPKCGNSSIVNAVQNNWNRALPLKYRNTSYIRRKITCTKCPHAFWTIEIPEEEVKVNDIEECPLEN